MPALLSWNVAGRVRRLDEQVDRVIAVAADVICLQEVTATTADAWQERLQRGGWSHVALARPDPGAAPRRRPLSVLTAARSPLTIREIVGLPWPERVLAASADGIEYVNAHSPISPSPALAKVRTHEAIHADLAAGGGPRVLCGDLNTP